MVTREVTIVECDAPTCSKTIIEEDLLADMDSLVSEWWQGMVWVQNEEPTRWVACSRAHIKAAVLEAYALETEDEE